MKSAILPFAFLFTFFGYSQDSLVKPDLKILEVAKAYSKGGKLVVLVIAGSEFDSISETDLRKMLKQRTSNSGLHLNVFIQRTEKSFTSSYLFFKDGREFSDKTDKSEIGSALLGCLGRLKGTLRDPE